MEPSMKLSTGKVTYPGAKSIRRVERDNEYAHDVLGLRDEETEGEEQLVPVIDDGNLVYEFPDLSTIQEVAGRNRWKVPPESRELEDPGLYDFRLSSGLETKTTVLRERLESQFG
jgi:nicotinate phosphoribosyltransferase